MDIWMVGCMAFVFLALCEFVIVKFIHWKKQQELKVSSSHAIRKIIFLNGNACVWKWILGGIGEGETDGNVSKRS